MRSGVLRVWPGNQGSGDADEAYFQTVVEDSRRIADLAQTEGVGIVYEFHANTLTDTNAAAVRLLQTVDHASVRSLWQPPPLERHGAGAAPAANLAGLEMLQPWLEHLHVFHWHLQTGERRLLAEGENLWRDYLTHSAHPDRTRYALLEFVQDDAPEAFLRDAATLLQWLGNGSAASS